MTPPPETTPGTEPVLARRGAPLALAVAGVLLWLGARALYFSAFARIAGSEAKVSLAGGALGAGAVCFLLSIAASVVRARALRRAPWGALLLAPILAVGAARWIYLAGADARALRETPGSLAITYAPDQSDTLIVRDAAGTWHVPYDACSKGQTNLLPDFLGHDVNFTDVRVDGYSDGETPTRATMRLHMAERRIECFGPAGPPPIFYALDARIGPSPGTSGDPADGSANGPEDGFTVVELVGDTLVYSRPDGETSRTAPSEADWRAFQNVLDSVGVDAWHEDTYDPRVPGGTAWRLWARSPTLTASASGRDRYPGADGTPRAPQPGGATTPEFERVRRALERLTGRPFR